MSSRRQMLPAVLLFGCTVLPSVAGADPVRITSGFLSVDGISTPGPFQLIGQLQLLWLLSGGSGRAH